MESCGSCVKKKKTKQNKENKTNDPNYTKPKHKGSTHKLTPRYGQYLSQVLSLFIQVHLQLSLFRFFSHVNALQSDKSDYTVPNRLIILLYTTFYCKNDA